MTNPTCATCLAFDAENGECHRHPPALYVLHSLYATSELYDLELRSHVQTGFPDVETDDSCLEHVPMSDVTP